jgi:hypothetical protein
MRNFVFTSTTIVFATVVFAAAAGAQVSATFVGNWLGDLEIRAERGSRELSTRVNVRRLPTSVEITRAAEGSYSVKQVSINQANSQIPVTTVTVEGDTIRWHAPAANGTYEGRLNRDGSRLRGNWTQNGSRYTLNFERVEP